MWRTYSPIHPTSHKITLAHLCSDSQGFPQTLDVPFHIIVFISPPVSPSTGLASTTPGRTMERSKDMARRLFTLTNLPAKAPKITLAAISSWGRRCIPAGWSSAFDEKAQPTNQPWHWRGLGLPGTSQPAQNLEESFSGANQIKTAFTLFTFDWGG